MKKLSKEAKFNLANGFGSLVSNARAIEAGKSMPVWLTILVGILAPALAMVPIMVNVANQKGESLVSGYTYSFDRNIATTLIDLNNAKVTLDVGSDHLLTYKKDGTAVALTGSDLMSEHINTQSGQYDIRTYFLSDTADKTINDYYKEITDIDYLVGTTTPKSSADPSDQQYYRPHYLFFSKDALMILMYKNGTNTAAASYSGDFKNTEPCDLVYRLGQMNGTVPTSYEALADNYEVAVVNNLKPFLNEAYTEIKNRTFLYTSTIYYSVYLGLVILLGFLTFILTRGKRNFNNYLKWYQCLGITSWAAISPGILALALGFLLQSYAIMLFILFLGVRTMWISMKQLSPTYNPGA